MPEGPRTISEPEAWAIADQFGADAEALLGPDLVAVVVVGSLAAGSYRPGQSDIDLIVIARDICADEALGEIKKLAGRYWQKHGFRKGFGGYGIRQRDLVPPFEAVRDAVYEILQLKRRGCIIRGHVDLERIAEPSHEDMSRSLRALVPDLLDAWQRSYPPPIDPAAARLNTIIYWLRILVWDRTGEYLLDKRAALAAAVGIMDASRLQRALSSLIEHVGSQQDRPKDVARLCCEVESYVLAHVAWARDIVGGD